MEKFRLFDITTKKLLNEHLQLNCNKKEVFEEMQKIIDDINTKVDDIFYIFPDNCIQPMNGKLGYSDSVYNMDKCFSIYCMIITVDCVNIFQNNLENIEFYNTKYNNDTNKYLYTEIIGQQLCSDGIKKCIKVMFPKPMLIASCSENMDNLSIEEYIHNHEYYQNRYYILDYIKVSKNPCTKICLYMNHHKLHDNMCIPYIEIDISFEEFYYMYIMYENAACIEGIIQCVEKNANYYGFAKKIFLPEKITNVGIKALFCNPDVNYFVANSIDEYDSIMRIIKEYSIEDIFPFQLLETKSTYPLDYDPSHNLWYSVDFDRKFVKNYMCDPMLNVCHFLSNYPFITKSLLNKDITIKLDEKDVVVIDSKNIRKRCLAAHHMNQIEGRDYWNDLNGDQGDYALEKDENCYGIKNACYETMFKCIDRSVNYYWEYCHMPNGENLNNKKCAENKKMFAQDIEKYEEAIESRLYQYKKEYALFLKERQIVDYCKFVDDKYVMFDKKMVKKYEKLNKTENIIFKNKMTVKETVDLFNKNVCIRGFSDCVEKICEYHEHDFFSFDAEAVNISDDEYAKYKKKCRLAKILYPKIHKGNAIYSASKKSYYIKYDSRDKISYKIEIKGIMGYFKMPKNDIQ